MSVKPPKALAPKQPGDNPLSQALEHEILAEKAATYGRLLRRLEKALAALREFDFAHGYSASNARGPARARSPIRPGTGSDGRASMASRPAGGSSAIRHGPTDHAGDRPKGGKRECAPAGQAAPAEAPPKAGTAVSDKERETLLDDAGQALWYVMIQRDLCGFRRHDLFYQEYGIPPAVRLRMGRVRAR